LGKQWSVDCFNYIGKNKAEFSIENLRKKGLSPRQAILVPLLRGMVYFGMKEYEDSEL
jgi:hypothetical protein